MSLTIASRHGLVTAATAAAAARHGSRCTTMVLSRGMAQTVPRLGSEQEMQQDAIDQIRARVAYQKQLAAAHGHSHEEEVGEMWRWVSITFWVALPICGLSALYSLIFDEHHHRVHGEMPEYMVVRSKEFPWECGECDLFDLKCWKKCRAAEED